MEDKLEELYSIFEKELKNSETGLNSEFVESFCKARATYDITADTLENYINGEIFKDTKWAKWGTSPSTINITSFSELSEVKELSEEDKNKLLEQAIIEYRQIEDEYMLNENRDDSEDIITNFNKSFASQHPEVTESELYNIIMLDVTRRATGSKGMLEQRKLTTTDWTYKSMIHMPGAYKRFIEARKGRMIFATNGNEIKSLADLKKFTFIIQVCDPMNILNVFASIRIEMSEDGTMCKVTGYRNEVNLPEMDNFLKAEFKRFRVDSGVYIRQ